MTRSIKSIVPLSLALAALLAYQFIGAAPNNPPSNNVPAPINIGTSTESAQVIDGGLAADSFVAGNISYAGVQMLSPQYCDENGENCFSAADSGPTTQSTVFLKFLAGTYDDRETFVSTADNSCSLSGYYNGGCDSGHSCGISSMNSGVWTVSRGGGGDCDATPTCTYSCSGPGLAESICEVQLDAEIIDQASSAVLSSESKIVNMIGTPRLGAVVECGALPNELYSTQVLEYTSPDGQSSSAGYWSETNYLDNETTIDSFTWKNIKTIDLTPGQTTSLSSNNNCSSYNPAEKETIRITASVLSCGDTTYFEYNSNNDLISSM